MEMGAIVGGVQLAAEPRVPSGRIAERREQRGRPLGDGDVHRAPQIRNGQRRSGQAREHLRRHLHGIPRRLLGRLVASRFEIGRIVEAETTADRPRRRAAGRGEEQEADAAVDRKHAAMVVEADDRVDVASIQKHSAEWRAAMVDRKTRRQHQADAAAGARERDRAFDEELVPVRVPVGLRRVEPGVAREPQKRRDVDTRAVAGVGCAGIGANHVPRWITDDRIEPGVGQRTAVHGEEGFREFQLPVKEPPRARDRFRRAEVSLRRSRRERAAAGEHDVPQRAERGGRHRSIGRRKPRGGPHVRDSLPARQQAVACGDRRVRALLLAHLLDGVVRRRLQGEAHRQRRAQRLGHGFAVEQRERIGFP